MKKHFAAARRGERTAAAARARRRRRSRDLYVCGRAPGCKQRLDARGGRRRHTHFFAVAKSFFVRRGQSRASLKVGGSTSCACLALPKWDVCLFVELPLERRECFGRRTVEGPRARSLSAALLVTALPSAPPKKTPPRPAPPRPTNTTSRPTLPTFDTTSTSPCSRHPNARPIDSSSARARTILPKKHTSRPNPPLPRDPSTRQPPESSQTTSGQGRPGADPAYPASAIA